MTNVTGAIASVGQPALCEVGGSGGMVLPFFGDSEQQWAKPLRAVLYAFGMIYTFFGVAIIADAFVASIEVVTRRKRQYKTKSGRTVTEKVWNDTVATLSLMALGSSAPEIALSVVDLFKKEFHFTPLGAQTIAGSAAFNLLVIVAVCIIVIPSPETRLVVEMPAYYVTAAVSVFAYFWLAFILIFRTPDIVEIWEAVATFLFLPMLIWVSYKVDIGDAQRFLSRLRGQTMEAEAGDCTGPVFRFSDDELAIQAAPLVSKPLDVVVKRPENAVGPLAVSYRTETLGAVPDYDYTEVRGRLEFAEDTPELTITLEILRKTSNRRDRKFLLVLEDIEGNAAFDGETDGGQDAAVMTVTVSTAAGEDGKFIRSIDSIVNFNSLKRGAADWKDQIASSVYCLGSYEEQQEATKLDWMGHIIALPWKLLFSLVPPTSYFGGWACFGSSLVWIGILTIFISDLAELFGCVIDVSDDVTALVFVALGTSMPDLFASLSAAREEPTADASIVNVTGSNSVNVFLGLGLPWSVGAIYWSLKGQTPTWIERYSGLVQTNGDAAFVVEAKNLGFCVLVFGAACFAALLILHLRRKFLGAELGGPFVPKVATFSAFILYWFGFIGVSGWRVDRWAQATNAELVSVIGGVAGFEALVTVATVVAIVAYRKPRSGLECKEGSEETTTPAGIRHSQSGLSVGSNSSKNSKGSRGINEGMLGVTVQGLQLQHGVSGVPDGEKRDAGGIGLRVLKPRYNNKV